MRPRKKYLSSILLASRATTGKKLLFLQKILLISLLK